MGIVLINVLANRLPRTVGMGASLDGRRLLKLVVQNGPHPQQTILNHLCETAGTLHGKLEESEQLKSVGEPRSCANARKSHPNATMVGVVGVVGVVAVAAVVAVLADRRLASTLYNF